MADVLPPPPIPAYVDLRHYRDMPLEVQTLLDSTIAGVGDAEIFRCAVLLWCKSWQQVPCGSLEDTDGTLARACGLGRDLKTWTKLKPAVLRGFRLASDGRIYHWMVAKKAAEAWNNTSGWQWGKKCDALRKVNKGRKDAGQELLPMPEKPGEISCGWDKDGPLDAAEPAAKTAPPSGGNNAPPVDPSGGASDGTPAENALKGREGNRKGREVEGNPLKDSVAAAPAAPQDQTIDPKPPAPTEAVAPKLAQAVLLPNDDELEIPLPLDRSPEATAVMLWNETARRVNGELGRHEWPEVQKLTLKRRKSIAARLKDCGGIDGWKTALDKASRSRWLRGELPRSPGHEDWRFNLNTLVREEFFTKIMETPDDDGALSRRQQPDHFEEHARAVLEDGAG